MFGFVIVTLMMWCGRVTANFAAQRGRSRRIWFIWGALLFPLFPAQWFVFGTLPKNKAASQTSASFICLSA